LARITKLAAQLSGVYRIDNSDRKPNTNSGIEVWNLESGIECGLVALVPLKRALFGLAAGCWMVPIISGDIHRGQRNGVAAAGAVIVVAFQSYDGNTRL